MIRIAITPAAFDAIAATLPLGSVGYEAERDARGNCLVWLDEGTVNRLGALRGPGESYSHVILRLVEIGGRMRPIARGRSGPVCGLPSTVTAATSISADAFARGPLVGPRPARLERVLTRSLGPSSIPSLGDGVMLGTAWIDRPVDTQGCAPCFHVLLSAAWKRGHAQANDRHSSRVFAMPPRGFARTTRNG